ncbi:hypothetical protein AB0I98_00750 [Streptomyces sp. NPDC050211]|uniref:hypothetical protein n=1 Tax=Streptomyces sp. NPDC050211 TaxID=3154932 RepID=UPI003417A11D
MGTSGQPEDHTDGPDEEITTQDCHVVDREVYGTPPGSGLPGWSMTVLLFECAEHGEEKAVDYYDPDEPPRCTQGDLMVRKP